VPHAPMAPAPTSRAGHVQGSRPIVMGGDITVIAAWGRKPGGTAGVGRLATGGSKPGGISSAGRRGAGGEVPAGVWWVPMVETVGPDSQRKSRSVRLGEAVRGKFSSSKTTCRETIR
jgi:hypothetical protein